MYDGTTKNVEDITPGDVLMGDDSQPRNVLSTCSGIDDLYEIDQLNGDPYIVNSCHVLSLMRTPDGKSPNLNYAKIDIGLQDYLKSSKTKKLCVID